MTTLSVLSSGSKIHQSPDPASPVIRELQSGELFTVDKESGWAAASKAAGPVGYIMVDPNVHSTVPEDVYKLIVADATVFLRNTEKFALADGLGKPQGPYTLGADYFLGDIIGLHDHFRGTTTTVRVVEVTYVFTNEQYVKIIPTFETFVERKPDE